MKTDIIPFTIELYEDVLALWRVCDGVGLSSADSRESIASYLARNPGMSFVALDGERIVGTVLVGHDGRRGFIHHLAVHPSCRRQGLGRRLVDRCFAAFAGAGILKAHILVFQDNAEAIAFWETSGWTLRTDIHVLSKNVDGVNGGTNE